MPIQVLDAQTVGRIAAGEVVERPSSVAKELIENALDAGATAITLEIKEGGAKYLRVTDNGCGIAPEDVRMAFENHATSKIRSGDLLGDIRTMGFRGEALPSIAAVSRVTVTTRVKGADSGVRMRVEGGQFVGMQEYGCPEGTTLLVEDLFYNLPVRKAFLKKTATEAGAIADLAARMILGYPSVTLRFINNGRLMYHSGGDGNLRHAAYAVYGRETAEQMDVVEGSEGGVSVSGLLGVGELSRSNRSYECFYINGRIVRCPLLTRTLEDALKDRVLAGMYPMCALSLTIPTGSVDVNVHPSKLEVRFRDEYALQLALQTILQRVMAKNDPMLNKAVPEPIPTTVSVQIIPQQEIKQTEVVNKPTEVVYPQTKVVSLPTEVVPAVLRDSHMPIRPTEIDPDVEAAKRRIIAERAEEQARRQREREIRNAAAPVAREETPSQTALEALEIATSIRVIGVFADTYILAEADSRLYMIDQHAAHERLLYEKYNRALEKGIDMQPLLLPIVLPVSPREMAAVTDNRALLLQAGYDVEPFGERDIQVRAVPFVLGQPEVKPLFLEMLDSLDRLKAETLARRREIVAQTSCKHAVKAGDALTEAEIRALIQDMIATNAPPLCAHGRPIVKIWTLSEIEKLFKRG